MRRSTEIHDELPPRSLIAPLFRAVHFPDERVPELQALAARGTIVYVMRSAGALSLAYFNHAHALRGLPRARVVHGLGRGPWVTAVQGVRSVDSAELACSAVAGQSGLVFLRHPEVFGPRRGATATDDPFPELVRRVREERRPVFLVPQVLVWERHPGSIQGSVMQALFGSPENPNPLRTAGAFLYNYRHAFAKVGEAIDLLRFCDEQGPGVSDALVARKVRGSLWQHLAREARVVTGPQLKSTERVVAEVLRDRTLRQALEELAKEGGKGRAELEGSARDLVREIAAHYSPTAIEVLKQAMDVVFNRIYDGIEVDRQGVDRIRRAAAKSAVILCPSHKSHVDYLILPVVLYDAGMTPPHVAAGQNLSFFPLGPLFRRAGAFFLRRSFKGDRLYGAVFRAYVKRLMRDGFTQEFFLEGGRSRTGKLLQPKLGLLSMEVDAWLEGASPDVSFVPIAIDYEKIVEAGAYASELAGGEKRKENVRGLLETPKVLQSRYGRIYLQVEEPISLRAFFSERGIDPARHSAEERRSLVQVLAHRIVYGIARASTVTPAALVAAALLAHERRGLSGREMTERISFLRNAAERIGARLSRLLYEAPCDPLADGPIREATELLGRDGSVRVMSASGETYFAPVEEKRAQLSFYKNNLLQHFVAPALLATALLSFREGAPPLETVRERTLWLSRLFKLEFVYRVGASFDQIFDETIDLCASLGLVEPPTKGTLRPASIAARERLELLHNLVRDFLESYWIAVDGLQELLSVNEIEGRELVRRALERGRAAFLAGRLVAAESLSRPNLENAFAYLREAGFLEPSGEKKLRLPERLLANPSELASLGEEIERYF
ncbi:MAG: 1-acyl-sn-glycerol-3-phosphate acyltransferase [Deltaproteobacteria bacterium]